MEKDEDRMLKAAKASIKAEKQLGKTVVNVNDDAIIQYFESIKQGNMPVMIGVKNTDQIERRIVKKLLDTKRYVWHTIDEMSEGGRAVDMNLLNPLTGKTMTGSSSATAINVLYGVNDIGIGTDGGGSVLAPALSLNLFSIMAKGMGLKGNTDRVSTDKIDFLPGIGVISQCFELVEQSIYTMLELNIDCELPTTNIKVLVCRNGNIELPDGSDMRKKLNLTVETLTQWGIKIYEEEFPDFTERQASIAWANKMLEKYDIIITCEGPVDLMGLGDSVFGGMGSFAKSQQNRSGKYMVKIANMINATAVTIPIDEAASGLVITAKEGMECGRAAIELGKKLKNLYRLPDLYYNYFRDSYKRRSGNNIFSVKGV